MFENATKDGMCYGFHCKNLVADETLPKVKFDVSLDEILHLISDIGFAIAYPQVFGISMTIPATSLLFKNSLQTLA